MGKFLSFVMLGVLLFFFFGKGSLEAGEIFVVNEDDSHFYGSRKPEEMNREGLLAWVDQYAGTKVTHLFLCPNCKNADFDSQTREAVWKHLDRNPNSLWPANAKRLHDAGLDAYEVWIARCREKGISPWITMRMNDVHAVNDVEHWIHSSFWRNHPEYWLPNRGLNYARKEVYEHNISFVRELFERYDMDGIELDWMRFCRLLTPGKEQEEAFLLTQFVAETRKLADAWGKKRGHEISVSVRVPTHPDTADALGIRAVEWARKGLVDWIVPAPEWSTTDFDIPVGLWKERLAGTEVKLVPCIEHSMKAHPQRPRTANDLASLYGWAETMRFRGADGVYLFNWMDCWTLPVSVADYAHLLKTGLGAEFLATQGKRYPITYRDTVAGGVSRGIQLGKHQNEGGTFTVPHGAATGYVAVILGIDGANGRAAEVRLNGVSPISSGWDKQPAEGIPCDATWRAIFPETALKPGDAIVTVVPCPEASGTIDWLEIRVEPSEEGGGA
ncbi:MAG: hypothetical protein Q4D62_00120 [Planctomycetia bacterium]|nr:hypothetical protein [Planctomycetia bacterium]